MYVVNKKSKERELMGVLVPALPFTLGVILVLLATNPVRGSMNPLGAGRSSASFGRGEPTNSWAVEILGGDMMAEEVAKHHGFINRGKVCN